MAQAAEELEALLNQDVNDLLENIDDQPQDPGNEQASVSHSSSTDHTDDDPQDRGNLWDPDDASDEEAGDEDQDRDSTQPTQAEMEAEFAKALFKQVVGEKRPKPKGPIMGEVIEVDGKYLIRMGGVPNCRWTGLARKSTQHPNQFRAMDPTKHYKVGLGLVAMSPPWSKSMKLSLLQNHVMQHLVSCGMEQHAYLPDPHKPTKMVNAILQPHLFARNLEATKGAINNQAKLYDEYDQGNDTLAHDFLLSCLDAGVNDTVGGLDNRSDLFLLTWIKVVRNWTIMTRERAQAIKAEVKAVTIKQFQGMDMRLAVAYLKPRLNALLETREIDPADMFGFYKSLHGVYPVESEHHLPWWNGINTDIITPLKDIYETAKLEMRKGPCEVEEMLIKATKDGTTHKGLDFKSILEKLENKYDKAYHSEEWPAQRDPVDSKAAPKSFGAADVHVAQPCTKADVMALMQNFEKLRNKAKSKADKICHNCGGKGHFARDPECPKNQAHTANNQKANNSSKKKFKKEKANWKHVGPKPGEPNTKTKDGKLWKWCAKCSNSRGRWTLSHTTEEHTGDKNRDQQHTPTVNLAATGDYSPCAWHVSLDNTWSCFFTSLWGLMKIPLMLTLLVLSTVSLSGGSISTAATNCLSMINQMSQLLMVHSQQLAINHPLIPWLLPFVVLGVMHLIMRESVARTRDHWWTHEPKRKDRRRQKRLVVHRNGRRFKGGSNKGFRGSQILLRGDHPRFKGASIKDKGFSKHYPRRLRAESRFWTQAPKALDRSTWIKMSEWFSRAMKGTKGSKRSYNSDGHRFKRTKPQGSNTWKRKPSHKKKPVPQGPSPTVRWQRSNRGLETVRKCWSCGERGHLRRRCPTARCTTVPFEKPVWSHSHSKDGCLDNFGRSRCLYPTGCPFTKMPSSSETYGPIADHYEPHRWQCYSMPTQQELNRAASLSAQDSKEHREAAYHRADQVMAFCVNLDENFLHAALTAPHKLKGAMSEDGSFRLIWDSGASHSITNKKSDFVGPIRSAGIVKTLTGLAKGLWIRGIGTVGWTVVDVNGKPRTLKVEAYYVPGSPVRLLSTAQLLQTYQGETIMLDDQSATLSGVAGDPARAPVKAFVNPSNNIPDCSAFLLSEMEKAAVVLHTMTTSVDPRNINLSEPEKELLRWHQRLGHLDFKRIQFLLRSGALCLSPSKRALHTQAAKLTQMPRCAACQFGKQTARPMKGMATHGTAVTDRSPVIKQDKLLPGQQVCIDHFVCTTKGVTLTSRGGANAPGYMGGCIMVDCASGLIHVEFQRHLNTHETLDGIEAFERMCLDHGVVPTNYISDSGTAFTSKEFRERLKDYRQIINFVGTSAHHHNAVAERAIRTIMSIARTMMMHCSTHWPEMTDATLWPLAVDYAVYIVKRVPDRDTGLSPLDVFTATRQPLRRLHDLHVFGSPAYLLDKKVADGKKLPQFKPRSERVIFVGMLDKHFAGTPCVLNPRTRTITTPYHVVFDDWFATVGSSVDEVPDFQTPEWQQLFGDSTYQFVQDGDWSQPDPIETPPLAPTAMARREQVGNALHRQHQVPLNGQPSVAFDQPKSTPHRADQRENPASPTQTAPSPLIPSQVLWRKRSTKSKKEPTQEAAPIKAEPTPIKVEPTPVAPIISTDSDDSPTPEISGPDSPPIQAQPKSRMVRELMDYNGLSRTVSQEPLPARRERREPVRLAQANVALGYIQRPLAFKASNSDPDTFTLEQALAQTENYDKWVEALEKEIRALEKHGVWEEVPVAEAKGDIIPVMFVMKIKRKPDGSLDKFKSRVVCRGDLMKNYGFETFSAVCAWSTIRMVLVLALTWGWTTCTCDYSNAFIHATLDTPVWIKIPKGYESTMPGQTCLKLKRSLYGTSFAPKLWSDTLSKALQDYGLVPSKHDPCLYSKPGVMACCYVDDLILAFKDQRERDTFFAKMEELGFTLTMDDTLESFLGIKFERHKNGSFTLTQPGLIQKIIDATNMRNCNPVHTPATPNQTLGKDPDGEAMTDTWSYQSVTGMLLYLSTNTRTDINFAVSQVCRFNHSPKQSHAAAVKRIVRYLAGTADKGMIMQPDGTLSLNCWSDADFAGLYKVDPHTDVTSAKSRMGYIIKLGNCVVVCKSQLISSVCLATAEAEYYSLSNCLRVLLPLRRTLQELAENLEVPANLQASTMASTAFEDNSAALSLATNHRLTSRTRHYHCQAHFFWDEVRQGTLVPTACPTNLMDADMLTKSLSRVPFEANRKRVMGW